MMKRKYSLLLGFVIAISPVAAQPQLGKSTIAEVVEAMTLEEKALLLTGAGMPGFGGGSTVGQTFGLVPGAAGTTQPIPRLGIPAIVVADGPAGLRIAPQRDNDTATYYATAFPVATLVASTWNTDLATQVGRAMGEETRQYGVDILLAPALNIHRHPLCGRNFEYYSEDPLLSGVIAAAVVNGVQSNGVGTSIKHFAVNNQETNRTANDSRLSERALREIYLKGFEITVKQSQPWTVMSSYNKVNGVYASESRRLLTDILRTEWGFEGIVMTDWFGGRDVNAQVHAGNDLLMPGRPDQQAAIVQAVNTGALAIADVDANVKRILEVIVKTPRFKGLSYTNKPNLDDHATITRQSASEGMVLLKNEAAALPLATTARKIAAFGVTSYDFIAGGTGSGDVNEAYTISLGEGLNNAGYVLDNNVADRYRQHIGLEKEKNKPDPNNPLAAFLNQPRVPEFDFTDEELVKLAEDNDVALITIGRNSGEFEDRKTEGDFFLTETETKLIESVTRSFRAKEKNTVVILNIGGVVETASWKALPDAILLAWQAGQEGGNSVADILSGKVNPSGKLPMTFPLALEDVPSHGNFPLDVTLSPSEMFGMSQAQGDPRKNIDYTDYEEDIFVGYRYYDTKGKQVSYPFGYGLSYTDFTYEGLEVNQEGSRFVLSVTVKNTGKVAGKEVVQFYIAAPGKTMDKPTKELRGFAKSQMLEAGKSEKIRVELSGEDLASYDERQRAWVIESGSYTVMAGSSSSDIRQQTNLLITDSK